MIPEVINGHRVVKINTAIFVDAGMSVGDAEVGKSKQAIPTHFTEISIVNGANSLVVLEVDTISWYTYSKVKHDCDSVQDTLWKLVNNIREKREISIDYYRANRDYVTHRIRPATVMFSDYYFYLIAFPIDGNTSKPLYFRADRIKHITVHRKNFTTDDAPEYDEGLLQQRSLLMWPGKLRTNRFEFSGPSVQAVLDKLPTAKIINCSEGKYLIEAEVYGDGIKMWLLSQGAWVKVIAPDEFVEEMKSELNKMLLSYC